MNIFEAVRKYTKIYKNYIGNNVYYVLLLTSTAVGLESLGIVMFMPLLESSEIKPGDGNGLRSILNYLIPNASENNIKQYLFLLIALIFCAKGLFLYFSLRHVAYLRAKMMRLIREDILKLLSNANYTFYKSKGSSYYANILNEQVNRMMMSFYFFTQYIAGLLNAAIYVLASLLMSFSFGLYTIILSVPLYFLFRKINKTLRIISKETSEKSISLTKKTIEYLDSNKYLKSTNQQIIVENQIIKYIESLEKQIKKSGAYGSFTVAIREPVAIIIIATLAIFLMLIYNENFVSILISLILIFRAITSIIGAQTNWQNTLEYTGGVDSVVNAVSELKRNQAIKSYGLRIDKIESLKLRAGLFQYPEADKPTLKNISFELNKGEIVCLIGKSGSGKSTLVDIILGNLKLNSGTYVVNDINIENIEEESLKQNIGYVTQEPIVYEGSVIDNITMWKTDRLLINEEMRQLAKQLDMTEIVDKHADERGANFSGGQRQRISYMREILRCPSLLVLDEATSALDRKTRDLLIDNIESIKRTGKIILLITHDESLCKISDRVYKIHNGELEVIR